MAAIAGVSSITGSESWAHATPAKRNKATAEIALDISTSISVDLPGLHGSMVLCVACPIYRHRVCGYMNVNASLRLDRVLAHRAGSSIPFDGIEHASQVWQDRWWPE